MEGGRRKARECHECGREVGIVLPDVPLGWWENTAYCDVSNLRCAPKCVLKETLFLGRNLNKSVSYVHLHLQTRTKTVKSLSFCVIDRSLPVQDSWPK